MGGAAAPRTGSRLWHADDDGGDGGDGDDRGGGGESGGDATSWIRGRRGRELPDVGGLAWGVPYENGGV